MRYLIFATSNSVLRPPDNTHRDNSLPESLPMLKRIKRRSPLPIRRGVAAVEFAVLLPLLLLILYGILEVGRLVNVAILVRNLAREGAAQASTGEKSASTVQTFVQQSLVQAGLPGLVAQVTVSNQTTGGDINQAKFGDRVKVSISLPADKVMWVPVITTLGKSQVIYGEAVWIYRKKDRT